MQGPKWPLFYSHVDPVWSLYTVWDMLYLGRAPRTKETLPDFHEWCRVTRHPRIFHGLTGCQQTPRFWGVTKTTAQTFTITEIGLHMRGICNNSGYDQITKISLYHKYTIPYRGGLCTPLPPPKKKKKNRRRT